MGTSESTPVSLAEHRDPRLLWPILAAASVGVHLVLLTILGLVRLEIQPIASSGQPIPIQLADEETASSSETDLSAVAAPEIADPPEATSEIPQAASDGQNASEAGIPTPSEAQPPSDTTDPAPNPDQPELEDAIAPEPTPNGSSETPDAPSTDGGTGTAGLLPGGNSNNGQLSLGIQADPNGRDLPDTLPQLQSGESLLIQPYLAGCGASDLGGLASSLPTAPVQMRITVEASGQISQATVVRSSGNSTVDALTACLVQQGLRLAPATIAGIAHPSDAVLLEARLQL